MYVIDFLTTRTRSWMVQNISFTIKLTSNMSQTRLRSVMKIIQILILITDAVGNVHARWSRDTYGMYCCILTST